MSIENKPNLAKAVIAVMKEVKGVEKGMTVGTGTNSYQGVSDYEVKKTIGTAMANNGLALLPIDVQAKTAIDRWEESNQYGTKQKQSVFTEVVTKYLLLHESGESVELSGYGHGVDSQDKGAGKATTYAMKYALLYSFLVPTGKIDDADATHSDQVETKTVAKPATKKEPAKPAPKEEKLDDRKAAALTAFKAIDFSKVISVLVKDYKLTYTKLEDFIAGETIERILEVYAKVK